MARVNHAIYITPDSTLDIHSPNMERRENKPSLVYRKTTTKPIVILLDLSSLVMSSQFRHVIVRVGSSLGLV